MLWIMFQKECFVVKQADDDVGYLAIKTSLKMKNDYNMMYFIRYFLLEAWQMKYRRGFVLCCNPEN